MSTEKRKTLNDISSIPESLHTAYDEIIRYDFTPDLEKVAIDSGNLTRMAEQESNIESLIADDLGVTPMMRSMLRQATSQPLANWLMKRSEFDTEIQPYLEKIRAESKMGERKANIERTADESEDSIIREAMTHKPYADAIAQKEHAERHFAELQEGVGGRPVTTFGHSWFYILLLFGITSVEWLVNYDAFFSWTGIPAIAAGFTIAMALMVAAAAHFHGEYLKQRTSRFAPHEETIGRDIIILAFVTAGLIAAFTVAGWARYSLAIHSVGAQGPMIQTEGIPSTQPNPLVDVYFSLGINVIVWLIGMVVAFMAHDEDHHLMRAELENWRRTRTFNRVHRRWEKRISLARAKGTHAQAKLTTASAHASVSTKAQKDLLAGVEAREEKMVYGMLASKLQVSVDEYRIALGNGLAKKGHHVLIGGNRFDGKQYMQHAIDLDGALLRRLVS